MSTTPVTAPHKKSNLLWWLLGFAAVAIAIVMVTALVLTNLVVKNVRVGERNKQVEISTPAGNLTLSATGKVKDVGLPIYPGATLAESGGSVELTMPHEEKVGVSAVHYRTSDPLKKVDAWYGTKLGPEFKREGPQVRKAKIVVVGVEVNSDAVTYVSDRGEGARLVVLEKTAGDVNIALARFGKQEAQ